MRTHPTPALAAAFLVLLPLAHAQSDFIVPAGQTLVYDTNLGPIQARNVRIEAGAVLRVVGGWQPLRIRADEVVRIDGTLDLSGQDGQTSVSFNIGSLFVAGGTGGPVGGMGGFGNPNTTTWSERGGPGLGSVGQGLVFRAEGGESGCNASSNSTLRRPAGGGGGAFGPDDPMPGLPTSAQNVGRIAFDGRDGAPTALGAATFLSPPRGGHKAPTPFVDGNAFNDFFGHAIDPLSGLIVAGELAAPEGGRAGGGGGNAIQSAIFPPSIAWTPEGPERGGAGGGGGGLGIVIARRIELGATGRVLANGGRGGSGENTNGLDRIGAAGGGGSGGMLLLQARVIDLSQALPGALSAIGGRGGRGANDFFETIGAGGNGGPGLIQLHVPQVPSSIVLPGGTTLSQLSAPTAKVLLPEPGL